MLAKDYTISELAEAAEVTTRTVRYYVAEDLLPPPEGGGRAAVYSAEHLDRLQLIKILKDEFLPLQEIRALLAGLDHQAVRDLLKEKQASEDPPEPSAGTAKAYLQTLLSPPTASEQTTALMRHKVKAQQQSQELPAAAPSRGFVAPAAEADEADEVAVEPTHWQRIPITADVELHIREGSGNPSLWQKIDRLVKLARQLLTSIIWS